MAAGVSGTVGAIQLLLDGESAKKESTVAGDIGRSLIL